MPGMFKGFHFWQPAPRLNNAPMAGTMLQHSHEPPLTRDEKQAPVALEKQWKEKRGGELDDDCSRPCRLTETPCAARAMPHE